MKCKLWAQQFACCIQTTENSAHATNPTTDIYGHPDTHQAQLAATATIHRTDFCSSAASLEVNPSSASISYSSALIFSRFLVTGRPGCCAFTSGDSLSASPRVLLNISARFVITQKRRRHEASSSPHPAGSGQGAGPRPDTSGLSQDKLWGKKTP